MKRRRPSNCSEIFSALLASPSSASKAARAAARLPPSGTAADRALRPCPSRSCFATNSSSGSSECATSSIAACTSPRVAKSAGTVASVNAAGSTSGTSSQVSGNDTRASGSGRIGVRRGDGAVARVLVVVDEDAVALFLPPLRGRERRRAALDLAPDRERAAAHVAELPLRLDADVDVDAARARRLRDSRRSRARSSTSRTTSAHSRTIANVTPGDGSRSMRSSSGWSTSSARTGHGFRSMQPRFTAQIRSAGSSSTARSAVRPLGKVMCAVSTCAGVCRARASGRTAPPSRR